MKSKKPTSVRLTPEVKKRLKTLAREKNVSQHTLIAAAIEKYILPTKGSN